MQSIPRIALVALATAALSAGPSASTAKRPVTIDDAVSLKSVGAPQISPDGSRILFSVRGWEWPGGKGEPDKGTKPPDARSHIWIVPAAGGEPARQLTFGDKDKGESSPAWSPDGRYISFTATRVAGAAHSERPGGRRRPGAPAHVRRQGQGRVVSSVVAGRTLHQFYRHARRGRRRRACPR